MEKPIDIKIISLIFVCTGNTCRSPMAEQIFADFLKRKGLNEQYKITSAGIFATKGDLINPQAVLALKKLGIKPKKQRSKQMTKLKVNKNDFIVCMTQGHKDWLINNYGNMQSLYSLKEITKANDVPDPFGLSDEKYLSCAKYLSYACEDIFNLIIKLRGEL